MPPHLNPLPEGRGRKKNFRKSPSPLRERVRVRVKLKHIPKRIPPNRIAINLVLPLIAFPPSIKANILFSKRELFTIKGHL